MKRIALLPILIVTLFHFSSRAQCWEQVWAEEFNYTGYPDPTIWTQEVGGGGWGNNELQYYKANDADNAWVEDGKLTITAIKETFGGRNYTSARLITKDKYSVQYGKIEARMKLPYGQGIWPAFWAMGQNFSTAGWPACGEIDIMEMIGGGTGRDNRVHGTIHWDQNGQRANTGGYYTLPSGIFADDYHTFSIIWDEKYIRWYVDNSTTPFVSRDISDAAKSEFHQDFFLLLNLAVGGNWPGAPNESTVFPQTYEIDYIRVYKKTEDVVKFTIQGNDEVAARGTGNEFSLPSSPNFTYQWSVPEDAVIESGQGTDKISVIWGCAPGEVECVVTGECGNYTYKKQVGISTSITAPMFFGENQKGITISTIEMEDTTYEWIVPQDAVIVSGQGTQSIVVDWGTTFTPVTLITESECGETETLLQVIRAGQYPYPDIHTPHAIPGVIEAVHFDYGGPGISWHDNSAANEGGGPRSDTSVDTQFSDGGLPNVGWITNGEWLEYTVKVEAAANYILSARMATANGTGGPFSISFNGKEALSGLTITNTGGWATFTTKQLGTVYLTPEDTLMRLNFTTGGFNLGKMTFAPDFTNVEALEATGIEIFPVPAIHAITVTHPQGISRVVVMDINGRVMGKYTQQESVSIDISKYPKGIYVLQVENGGKVVGNKRFVKN